MEQTHIHACLADENCTKSLSSRVRYLATITRAHKRLADEIVRRLPLALVPAGTSCSLHACVGVGDVYTSLLVMCKGSVLPLDAGCLQYKGLLGYKPCTCCSWIQNYASIEPCDMYMVGMQGAFGINVCWIYIPCICCGWMSTHDSYYPPLIPTTYVPMIPTTCP